MSEHVDVLVIGGGPAGATSAALLAEDGWQVALLEKVRHPRFHIGESLLPQTMPILERLGVSQAVSEIGVPKPGADFTCQVGGSRAIRFADALNAGPATAYQVKRSEFDKLLLDNARRRGVAVQEETVARRLTSDGDRVVEVEAVHADGTPRVWRARQVIDASGRDGLVARRLGLRVPNRVHQTAAIFGHFRGAVFRDGEAAGNISIYWFEHGWLWMIPLAGDVMSIGAVCTTTYLRERREDPACFLWRTIALCPGVAERTREARLIGPAHAASNYAYGSRRMAGENYVLIGDAFAFVDPIFSSGVHFAMTGADLAAGAVAARLRGSPDAPRALTLMERRIRHGLALMSWLILRFNSPALRRVFLHPGDLLDIERTILAIVAGDVFGRTRLGARFQLFKLVYYASALMGPGRDWRYWRAHRRDVALALADPLVGDDA
jgi:flavin-dependent dehydrogenase